MAGYDFASIESKWQQYWADNQTFRQPNPGEAGFKARPKMYILDMFPYPSGAGLHVGHPEGYTATDIVARFGRMKGYNVLHPMGYDSFGLPAEQYAVEHGVHPRETTAKNIANIERQIKMFGFSYDWSRRVATTDVAYYRWTQWIFLQLYNSWYDPDANAARPISELIKKLETQQYLVDSFGNLVLPTFSANWMNSFIGVEAGVLKYAEMTPNDRRRLIDEYRLAYMAEVPVNWCPKLGTVLANEEVTNEGKSDRGNYPVYRRAMKQWMLRITAYADRLLADIDNVDWPEPIKIMQRNWIGKSTGAEVDFVLATKDAEEFFADRNSRGVFPTLPDENVIRVYTTRPDTLFGATYMVLAPEHELVGKITTPDQKPAVAEYIKTAANKSELERTADAKEKTGVFTGAYAINPVTRHPIPIWVADYVMMGYGTGAIMAVPAHDTRDFEFAKEFNLPIIPVVGKTEVETCPHTPGTQIDGWREYESPKGVYFYKANTCIADDGIAINSGPFDGMRTQELKAKITACLAAIGLGKEATNYKLRDWLFSRQRYWGEPFPIVHCEKCGTVALSEKDLPLTLPEMADFKPAASDDPDAMPKPPLGKATEWVNTTCPNCGGPATRELNTMPQWAGSCWYYLRYLDPKNELAFCNPKIEEYWMQTSGKPLLAPSSSEIRNPQSAIEGVDLYVGGAEHAVLHLLYSRFWHKVLFDLGYVSTAEPFGKLFNQGMIRSFAYRDKRGVCLAYEDVDTTGDKPRHKTTGEELVESIEKMSKSLKNVVNPDEVIAQYGADTFRLYEMFMGPLESSKPWNTRDVPGVHRFLQRVWRAIVGDEDHAGMVGPDAGDADLERALHKLIKKAGEDITAMKFNTAIAAMMEFVNQAYKVGHLGQSQAERLTLVLAPFAPHIAEELWVRLGHDQSLAHEDWPAYDPAMTVESTIQLPVQVNGKLRAVISAGKDADQESLIAAALADPKVVAAIADKTIVKKIVVPGKMINLVIK